MSNAILTAQILADLQTAVVAAWAPGGIAAGFPISWEEPRLPIGSDGSGESLIAAPNGHATIEAEKVGMAFGGATGSVNRTNHTNEFTITGYFPWPSDPSQLIVLEQIAKVNALIAQLQEGPNFGTGGYGILPIVSEADLKDRGGSNNHRYTVTCTFTVFTRVPHH